MEVIIKEVYLRRDAVKADTFEEAKRLIANDEHNHDRLLHKKDWNATYIYLFDRTAKDPRTLVCEILNEDEPPESEYYVQCQQIFARVIPLDEKHEDNPVEYILSQYNRGELYGEEFFDSQIDTLCTKYGEPYELYSYFKI